MSIGDDEMARLRLHIFDRWRIRRRLADPIRSTRPTSTADPVTTLAAVARSVHGGLTLRQAIIECGTQQSAGVVHLAARDLRAGRSLSDVCAHLADPATRLSGEDRRMIQMIGLAHSMGGDEAGLLEATMQSLIERRQERLERSAHAATVRASMRLLTWLPLVCGLWIASENPLTRQFLVGTSGGRVCLVTGVVLNLLGRLWSRRIIVRS